MKKKNEPSQYDFFKGKFNFTNEPLWFRLTLISIFVGFIIGVVLILRVWAIPFWTANFIAGMKSSGLINLFKGRSP